MGIIRKDYIRTGSGGGFGVNPADSTSMDAPEARAEDDLETLAELNERVSKRCAGLKTDG